MENENIATLELVAGEGLAILTEAECIESAISATAIAASDADGMTLLILQDHLSKLCRMQRKLIKDQSAAK